MEVRYRKGTRGLYYTDGKLDDCDYNTAKANFFEVLLREYRIAGQTIPQAITVICEGAMGFIYLICYPVLPFVRVLIEKYCNDKIKNLSKQLKTLEFPKGFYEEVMRYDEEDPTEDFYNS